MKKTTIAILWYRYLADHRSSVRQLSCTSHLDQEDNPAGYQMNTSAYFVFGKNHYAMVTFDGTVNVDEKKYKLKRTMTFNYEHFSGNIYSVSNVITNYGLKDTLPGTIFEKYFFSTTLISIAKIKNIPNAVLIGNFSSPAFMCIYVHL